MKVDKTIFFIEYAGWQHREGYGHPSLKIAAYYEDEKERVFVPSDSSHWETGLLFSDLEIYAQCSKEFYTDKPFSLQESIYGWRYQYRGYMHLNTGDIKRMAKTVSKIKSYMRRVEKQHGRAESFGVYAFRVAKALNMPIKRKGRFGWLEVDAVDINNDSLSCWRELNPEEQAA